LKNLLTHISPDKTPMKPAPLRLTASVILLACVLLAGACQSKSPSAALVPLPTVILNLSEVDQPPHTRGQLARPQYPFNLRRAGISGDALVRFIVTADGRVVDVTAIRATHPSFGAAAAEAVSKWRYQPALKDGQPVACRLQVPIFFNLNVHSNTLAP
jgi:TonB family protein